MSRHISLNHKHLIDFHPTVRHEINVSFGIITLGVFFYNYTSFSVFPTQRLTTIGVVTEILVSTPCADYKLSKID